MQRAGEPCRPRGHGSLRRYPTAPPPAAEYDRLKAKRKLENCWFVLRNSSVEMAENVIKLDDGARDLLAWLDVNLSATKDEPEAKQAEMQNGLNELLNRQIAVAGKKRKLEDQ